jgi:CLIP-associating protein 1/2
MFTAATVTDSARADLKKEMTKKNVRKGIVDTVLSQLFASNTQAAPAPAHPPEETSTPSAPSVLSRQTTASTLVSNGSMARTATLASSTASEFQDAKTEDVVPVYVSVRP